MISRALFFLLAGELVVGFAALAITVSVLYFRDLKSPNDYSHSPTEIYANLANPLTGWAPLGNLVKPLPQPFGTVFMVVNWRQIEPNRTVFQWDSIESAYQFDRWELNKKYFILRIVLDQPTNETHSDLPDWLMDYIGGDGTYYNVSSVGVGFSPNYANPGLIGEHERLINTTADHFSSNSRFLAVQIGSIGHNGEWSTAPMSFPASTITAQYVDHYRRAFSSQILQFFRPVNNFTAPFGLHVSGFGNKTVVDNYTQYYYTAGSYLDEAGEIQVTSPTFYDSAPVSGSFYSTNYTAYLGNVSVYETLNMAKSLHISFVGPNCPANFSLDGSYQANMDMFVTEIGYRFVIQSVQYPEKVTQGNDLKINLVVANRGLAPFYLSWPLEVSLFRLGKSRLATNLNSTLSTWDAGAHSTEIVLKIPSDLPKREYNVCIAILDGAGTPGVQFSNDDEGLQADGRRCYGQVQVQGPGLSALVVGLIGGGIGLFTLGVVCATYFVGRRQVAAAAVSEKVFPSETGRNTLARMEPNSNLPAYPSPESRTNCDVTSAEPSEGRGGSATSLKKVPVKRIHYI